MLLCSLSCQFVSLLNPWRLAINAIYWRSGTRQEFRPRMCDHRKSWRLALLNASQRLLPALWLALWLAFGLVPAPSIAQDTRDVKWKSVRQAIDQGLPQTAIDRLDPMIDRFRADGNVDAAIHAVCWKITLEGQIEGNKPEEKITRLREEIEKSSAEMKPVMEAILANWYWQYFSQNRWRFAQRTETAQSPSDDFTTWGLDRILSEVDAHFQTALSAADALQTTPVGQFDELLEPGTAPTSYRPTLYDVLVCNALDFYSAGEHAATQVRDAFEVSADGPIFDDRDAFLAWQPETDDQDSALLRGVQLYQSLIRFHQADADPSALLDADQSRLTFGNNHAFGEDKDQRFRSALRRLADANIDHPIAAMALNELAQSLRQSDPVAAHAAATEGLTRHPDSVGGRRCYNMIQEIESPSATIMTERVWNLAGDDVIRPTIDVAYKNVTKVYLRLVRSDFQDFLSGKRSSVDGYGQNEMSELLTRTPIAAWSADLPATDDYQVRTESVDAPAIDAPGSYLLIASHDKDFASPVNQLSLCDVWVSDLSMVVRNHSGDGLVDGFLLDARTGDPIVGANVEAWSQSPQQPRNRKRFATVQTDTDGMFRITGGRQQNVTLLASANGQQISSANQLYLLQSRRRSDPVRSAVLFTDRSIYRPGQTIQFKGICYRQHAATDDYRVLSRTKGTVVFTDVNGKEIEKQAFLTNDFGSFSGSFVAPRDRLTGQMRLSIEGPIRGQASVTVEEYKRPKFRVELKPPSDEVKLGENVTVTGEATAYTGVAIGDASVSWRVVRQVQYPIWWLRSCWWMPVQQGASQEIAHGTATTDPAGRFDVSFVAQPDSSVSVESDPTFEYQVYADVTDTTGETRSDQRTVRVGYTALSASVNADDWLTDDKPTEITIRTESLDGESRAANGKLTVYRLQQPDRVHRPALVELYRRYPQGQPRKPDLSDPVTWDVGEAVFHDDFATDASGRSVVKVALEPGMYRAKLVTKDAYGKDVHAETQMRVLDPDSNRLTTKVPFLLASPSDSVQPGQQYVAVWGSGYDRARAYVEIECRGEIRESFWTDPADTQMQIKQMVDEKMRGGFTLRVTMVRDNRANLESRVIDVPWTNKKLDVQWEHFVSKLAPAAKETWTAVIQGPDSEAAAAEMVATLYDASLDAYLPHVWQTGFTGFRRERSSISSSFENQPKQLRTIVHGWQINRRDGSLSYVSLPPEFLQTPFQQFRGRGYGGMMMRGAMMKGSSGPPMHASESMMMDDGGGGMGGGMAMSAAASPSFAPATGATGNGTDGSGPAKPEVDFGEVAVRKNLNETAFFFPKLIAADDGTVRMEFTMPEALTEWKFLGFAHDRSLRSGGISDTAVTAKDLMVVPNPPRFVREGDEIEFTVKVSNQSPTRQTGSVRLTFADARTTKSVDSLLENNETDQPFQIAAGQSQTVAWRIRVPDGLGAITYKAVGSTGRLSDGEEGVLPVLSRRVLVTESITLPIRGKQTKQFDFDKLLRSGDSDSLEHQSVTAQMVSNPSWYAVMALPYLMEYPHQCSEQTFNRFYANAMAQHIATSNPKIRRVFDQWRATPALDSPLQQNEELKSVVLEETPWVRQAESESQARRNVGILFDKNRLEDETARTLHQLTQMQKPDGMWPWFPGGGSNRYITLYITTGFGRMRHLGVDVDMSAAIGSLQALDQWMSDEFDDLKEVDRSKNHLSNTVALYLYGRSFFLKDQAVAPQHQQAFDYWVSQAKQHWLAIGNRQSQAHIAIALTRLGDRAPAEGIMRSIKERSVTDEEMGRFWRDTEASWWWYHAPIESQAMMIEAFDEVMDDAEAVEDCKVWLLKQKQTQDWKTTKATSDAVYALLLRGSDQLASDELVQVSMGGKTIQPQSVEAGTGFFEERFAGADVTPSLGDITVTKVDDGVAWGSVSWQYLEDMSKVTAHDGTPLKLTKSLFVKTNTDNGPTLVAVDGPVSVGDELVVRIVLRTDRDMEYVHLKDYRGSGTEPTNVLSQYRFQDGLAYYESTRDTASHFFIDYLPKGTYVFEYSTRVQLRGQYQTGYANIQCMYAPEFAGHSESLPIVVK
ncbi:MG2 domain protein [Rubripirellula lacrimiformis]|uniref:MG2 domain protein n=1 Tax=Rubripirellula lacrimiformis TaxID=1930273 RepID=A0A517NLE5_9BACT|nr:alpha-2-macroglobulin family protein [Rubripirellula lacrimiformis]QDT07956.1 MG2 domain protein [Rubripirellula lacrimiformis]